MFKSHEILDRSERLWRALVNECQRAADCFNAKLGSQHPDAIQPFLSSQPFMVVIRQLHFPETRVECTMNRDAKEIVVTWFRKASHQSDEAQRSEILDLDVVEETGDILAKRDGILLSTDQLARLILTPLLNIRERASTSGLAS